jgi:hypothetical protein
MHPVYNRYGYGYQVDQSSDLTPLDENMLEPVNAYIPNSSIVNNLILTTMYKIDNDAWYANNLEIAADYFGDISLIRIMQLKCLVTRTITRMVLMNLHLDSIRQINIS